MPSIKSIQAKSHPISSTKRNARLKHLLESNKGKTERASIDVKKFDLSYYEWTLRYRRLIEGKPNVLELLPMWEAIYKDEQPWIMLAMARQLGKTTYGGGRLAYQGTQMHTKSVYVTYSDESLRSFSNDKYRGSILHTDNPELYEVVKGAESGKGAMSRVEFLTNSSTSLVTHANEFHHVEGKSADFIFYDEDQNLNLSALAKAKESQAWTQGQELYGGVGGYIGSEQHKLWLSTNQMEWVFNDPDWYDTMIANPKFWNDRGFVWHEDLPDLLAGKWEAKAPANWTRHGYHLTQMMFPNIPRTMEQAIHKYRVSEERSIEWKRREYPANFFERHVMANFVKGQQKPFTKEMILELFDRSLYFTRPEDVDRKKGKIYASADWGGGMRAFTVPCVAQCVHPTAPVFKILYITRLDEPDVEKQADAFINLCNAYEVDKIGIDAGGGPRQAQKVELTFASRCVRINYRERPQQPLPTETEMRALDKENRFSIDRTYSLDRLKDMIENPFIQGKYAFPRFIIPAAQLEKVAWIADDFEAIEGELIRLKSTGQDYIRYDNPLHPDDAAHTLNYLWMAQMLDRDSAIWLKSF